jgi:hypothetical protein
MLQTDLKVVTSVVADSSKADLDAAGAQRIHDVYHETSRLTGPSAAG